jgi:hypothetical protein
VLRQPLGQGLPQRGFVFDEKKVLPGFRHRLGVNTLARRRWHEKLKVKSTTDV